MHPNREILTTRMRLIAPDASFAAAVAAYYIRDRDHLQPWYPPMDTGLFTEEGQAKRLADAWEAFETGSAFRWWMTPLEDPTRAIGNLQVSQVFRGPFCSAILGYAIEEQYEGRGLMREALEACISEMFSERGGLHRLQANVRPENERSLRLLDALGFQREGYAKDYLFIDGAWRDHVMTAHLNSDFSFAPPS